MDLIEKVRIDLWASCIIYICICNLNLRIVFLEGDILSAAEPALSPSSSLVSSLRFLLLALSVSRGETSSRIRIRKWRNLGIIHNLSKHIFNVVKG